MKHTRTLSIDIETYSGTDLKKSGVYKYVEDPEFRILLFAYAFDGEEPKIVEPDEVFRFLPDELVKAITDPAILKTAHNAAFERTCIAKLLNCELDPAQWECTMIKSAMLGLPLSLEAVGTVLKLQDQKDSTGKALIRYFCVPCKPSKVNDERTRNLPEHAPEKWEQFKNYCLQDVRTEQAIRDKIKWFEIPEQEKELWDLDQHINDEGVLLDHTVIRNALSIDKVNRERLFAEAVSITGLSNPNSGSQLKEWLMKEMPYDVITTLKKADIPVYLKQADIYENRALLTRLLTIRQEMSKTSIKKYNAMEQYACTDGRARGLLQFYGASRTGRWAGRGIQLQNLPRIDFKNEVLDFARQCVCEGDTDSLDTCFTSIPDTLSQLIRTAFVPENGKRFIVADFSAIEARVIAWVANEKWRMDVFNTHGKIYEASASAMFRVPLESVTKDLRQRGKVAELALGYQGGPNALIAMGALDKGIKQEELKPIVDAWRNASPAIVKAWYSVNDAAIECVQSGNPTTCCRKLIGFRVQKGVLFMRLPSGRELGYLRPQLKEGKFGSPSRTYEGLIQTTNKWGKIDTYGGKFVENAVQAIARDCLAYAMQALTKARHKIVMHVHDEVVCEIPEDESSLEELCAIMATPIPWAPGLPLAADGFEGYYYKK